MADTTTPVRPISQVAAIDAVQALSIPLDALIALEALLQVRPAHQTDAASAEQIGTLISVLNTRLFLDLKAAEESVLLAFHNCSEGS